MFQRVRKQITPATVMAFVALVFAVTGGAFAATGGSGNSPAKATAAVASVHAVVAKAKKKAASTRGPAGPKGATGATGATGPAGPGGPAGAAGAKGEDGAAGGPGTQGVQGEKGTTGTNGESVKSSPVPVEPGAAHCPEGGAEFTAEKTKKTYACNGEKGVIHPGETLPSGASETGVWLVQATGSGAEYHQIPISFPIPLKGPENNKSGVVIPNANVHYIKEGTTTTECPGSSSEPTAEKGNFCIYEKENFLSPQLELALLAGGTGSEGVAAAGTFLDFKTEGEGQFGVLASAKGTWAVTAP